MSDEWSSMISNKIFEEIEAFEKTSKCTSTEDKKVNDKHKSLKTSDQNIDVTRFESEKFKDHLADLPHNYKEKLETRDFLFKTINKISDDRFYETDSDVMFTTNKYQVSFSNGQNVTLDYNFKSDIDIIEVTDTTEMTVDSAGKVIYNETENDDSSISISENSKDKMMLIDLEEAFIKNSEGDSTKAEGSANNIEISFSSENWNDSSKDLSEITLLQFNNLNSFRLDDFRCRCKEELKKCTFIVGHELIKNSFEELYFHNKNIEFATQLDKNNSNLDSMQAKAQFQKNKLSPMHVNLGSGAIGFPGINRYSDESSGKQVYKHNKNRPVKRNPKKDITTVSQKLKTKADEDEIAEDVEEIDKELDVNNQRANFVIARYREICSVFKTICRETFVKNVLFVSFEMICFICFIITCVFLFLLNRIQFLISNYRSFNINKPSDNTFYGEENTTLNPKDHTTSTTTSDTMPIDESTCFGREQNNILKLSFEESDVKKYLNINSWIKVQPEEVETITTNWEVVTENVIQLNEDDEHILLIYCSKKQHKVIIRTNADFIANFEFINSKQNEEI